MRWGRSCYISTFPCSHWKIFWWDRSGKFKNTRSKGTDQEKNLKQEGRNGGKRKKEIFFFNEFTYMEVPILMCSPLGQEHPRTTLHQENSLVWETPLKHSFIHFIHSFTWKPGRIFNLQHMMILRVFLTFRNVEILKECSFRKNQILLRENRESC
jgi:hypothetical protein